MNINEIKTLLEQIGHPVEGCSPLDVIGELHQHYGSTKVGSSMNTLGDAAPLYCRAGNVAHLIDNPQDLIKACLQIRSILKQREGAKTVVMQKEVRSRFIGDIRTAVENEIDIRQRTKRPLGFDTADFPITSDGNRNQSRSSDKIIDGLLSKDNDQQRKALDAFRNLMISQEAE